MSKINQPTNNNSSPSPHSSLPPGWKETTLGKLPIKIGDGNYSSKYPKASELLNHGVPFISNKDINNGRIDSTDLRYLSVEKHSELKKGHLKTNDVLMSTRANIGDIALTTEEFNDANINAQLVFLRADEIEVNAKFLFYLLRSKKYRQILSGFSSGSAQQQLPIGSLIKIPITYPCYKEQQAIAAVLSSLDDKIELLREQNKTLESLAQTIFKEWFVKFNFPGSTGKMINSELGKIPEGWRVEMLGNYIDLQGGFVHDTGTVGKKVTLIAKMGVVDGKNWFNRNSVIEYADKIPEKHRLDEDDLIVCTRDVTQDRVVIGNIAIAPPDLAKEGLFAGSNTWIIKTNFNKYYLFLFFRSTTFREHIIQSAKGSTIVMITKDAFLSRSIVIPNAEVLANFANVISPVFQYVKNNSQQIQTITKLRDTILPKLMSGEIRVS